MRNPYHTCDLRKAHHSVAGKIYLVTTVTHRRLPLFEDLYTGRQAVKALCSSDWKGSANFMSIRTKTWRMNKKRGAEAPLAH